MAHNARHVVPAHTVRHYEGISLITLIITIVSIIILASIAIFNGLKTPAQAQFAKFSQEISDIQEAVTAQYNKRFGELTRKGASFTDSDIYTWIAAGDAATSSGWETITPSQAYQQYGFNISNQDLQGNELQWQVKVISSYEKEVVEIDGKNNNVGVKVPQYEDRSWKIKTTDGTVFLDPPIEYNGTQYATLADVQNGKGEGVQVGEFDTAAGVNAPILTKNMIPVYYDGSVWRKADSSNKGAQKWYDYTESAKQWANMVTVDSSVRSKYRSAKVGTEIPEGDIIGFWVWIPRYAYRISGHSFDIVFLQGTSDHYLGGEALRSGDAKGVNYLTHPVFTKNSATSKGGWKDELTGFWVAKFEASNSNTYQVNDAESANGYQPVVNGTRKIAATGTGTKSSTTGASGTTAKGGSNGGSGYATFLPNVTSWRSITTVKIKEKSDDVTYQHGLKTDGVDSHMLKNTEWGAVAYLAQSAYGNDEIWANSYYEGEAYLSTKNQFSSCYDTMTGMVGDLGADDATPYTYEKIGKTYNEDEGSITIHYQKVTSTEQSNGNYVNSATDVGTKKFYRYNTTKGVRGSTTGNIYGVYDMSGGAWEYMAAYVLASPNTGNVYNYGKVPFGTVNNEYVNIYAVGSDENDRELNYKANLDWKGDAVAETSTNGTGATSWNRDYSYFPYLCSPLFGRGGNFYGGALAGVFAFSDAYGSSALSYGFRVALVP